MSVDVLHAEEGGTTSHENEQPNELDPTSQSHPGFPHPLPAVAVAHALHDSDVSSHSEVPNDTL